MTPTPPHPDHDPRSPEHDGASPAKTALRDQMSAARRRLSLSQLSQASMALSERVNDLPEVRRAATVAAYVSVGSEPGTGMLLEALLGQKRRVVVPVVRPDLDLDWAEYRGHATLARAGRGLLEPTSPRLGLDAVATADVVLVPGLAVGPAGERLGQGGGCYDRALARVPEGTLVCALLHDGETGHDVPTEAHDLRVGAAVTPGGVVRFG